MAMLPVRRSGRNVSVVNPSREFEDIYNRMGQLVNLAFGGFPPAAAMAAAADLPWVPPVDLSETDSAYVVRADLPGVSKDQIDIQLQDRELVISGEIPEQEQSDQERTRRSSRPTGRFEFRTILPGEVNPDGVTAQLTDGVLTVTIPKSEQAKPRHIEISG